MYQTHSQPKQQQYITLLDKCTHPPPGQDMVEKHGKIGPLIGNKFIQGIAKEHRQDIDLYKKDMKQLQIKLRKYIMRTKQREKQQQLQRFKQNMQLPDFVEMAAQKRQQYVSVRNGNHGYYNNNKRGPLIENEQSSNYHPFNPQSQQNHQQRSSFVAKWNNYSHYNYPTNGNSTQHYSQQQHNQQTRQLQPQQPNCNASQQQPSRSMTTSTSNKKQWQHNYKPHSFNKNLNYQLANKLSTKNGSFININNNNNVGNNSNNNRSRHNLSTTSLNKGSKQYSRGNNSSSMMMTTMNVGNTNYNNKNSLFFNNNNTNTNSNSRRKLSNNNNITDQMQESGRFGNNTTTLNHRSSSKSLKQLQNRIYQELKVFQQNKSKRQVSNQMNKSFSQRSIDKYVANQKDNNNNNRSGNKKTQPFSNNNNNSNIYSNPKPVTTTNLRTLSPHNNSTHTHIPPTKQVSKQSIDQILKFKLGNCDFQTYKRQHSSSFSRQYQQDDNDNNNNSIDSSLNQYNNHYGGQSSQFSNLSKVSHHSNDSKIVTSSQKKLYYNDSMFPPIEEQTERDSQSQRYPQQPLRFGQLNSNNPANSLRQQLEERQKMVFASFAKGGASPIQNNNNELILSGNNQYAQQQADDMIMLQSFNPQQHSQKQSLQTSNNNTLLSVNNNHNKKISQSLYQSAQKKSDFTQNFVESDLHKSIMQSIKKSRQLYPLEGDKDNTNVIINQTHSHIPYRQATSQVTSFSSSLYASTSNQNNDTIFTSPELLNQCRNFLKKTQQINFQNSGLGSNFTSSMKNTIYESPTNSQQQRSKKQLNFQMMQDNNNNKNISSQYDNIMLHFPQPITITQSITKDYYEHHNNQFSQSQVRINSMFESKQSSSVKKNIQFETYSKPQQRLIERSGESNCNDEMMMRDSVREDNFNNNNNMNNNNNKSMLSSSQSARRQQPLIVGHSRKNSSIKRHSEIQQTLTAGGNNYHNQPTTMQFNLSSNPTHVLNNNYMHPQQQQQHQNDNNYRTSQFKQVQQSHQQQYHQLQQSSSHHFVQNKNRQQQYYEQQQQQQQHEQQLYEMIEMQEIIDRLLQANEGNLQLDSTWLKHTIANHCIFQTPIAKSLSKLLQQFIIQPSQTHNFIDLLDVLYAYYRTQCPNYRPRKSPAADVYSLLDIEEKGYIVQDDLQNFISQLESAGVENIDEICHNLQQTFQMADFLSIKKIGYVNLYVIKNEDCFDALWGELQQFEFEVEGEQ